MFSIPIKMEAHERRRSSIPLLHMVAGLFLLANAASLYKYVSAAWMAVPFYVVALASVVYGALQKKDAGFHYNSFFRSIQAVCFLIIALLVLQHNAIKSAAVFLWVAISVLLFFAEKETVKPAIALFNAAGVQFPGNYAPKRFAWNAIHAVTVRPDFITLHLQQNKVLQVEPADLPDLPTIEKLQAFCNSKTASEQTVL